MEEKYRVLAIVLKGLDQKLSFKLNMNQVLMGVWVFDWCWLMVQIKPKIFEKFVLDLNINMVSLLRENEDPLEGFVSQRVNMS